VRIERLGLHHALNNFDCGVKALNGWLINHAKENERRDLSRTFVLIDDADEVVGFYSLTAGGVQVKNLPKKLARGLPNFDIGMVLLGRLALSRKLQGQGLGRDLLVDAVLHAAAAGESAAARFIAVDLIDESARSFYAAFGFQDIGGDVLGRMCLRIDEAVAALREVNDVGGKE
jgi:GNAT superfamily N-acetyltransferase